MRPQWGQNLGNESWLKTGVNFKGCRNGVTDLSVFFLYTRALGEKTQP